MTKTTMSERGEQAERALREAVAAAVDQHRNTGRPIVVNQNGKPVFVDPREVHTVRERPEPYAASGTLRAQIEQLASVRDGWMEGQGKAPDKEQLAWAGDRLVSTFPADLPYPHVAPTPEGGLSIEWIESPWRISAEIPLPAHRCEVQAVNTRTGLIADADLNMDDDAAWGALYLFVRNHLARPA
jgi:hypothetical protein